MRQGEWRSEPYFTSGKLLWFREDPLRICPFRISPEGDRYRLSIAWEQFFYRASGSVEELKELADKIYHVRVQDYAVVLQTREENVKKDIKLAKWLLSESKGL